MDKEPTHIKILVALIALVGMLGAAAIPTFFGRQAPGGSADRPTADAVRDMSPEPEPEPEPEPKPKPKERVVTRLEPEIPDISGHWRGVDSPGESYIEQSGRSYTVRGSGVSGGVAFQSQGQGQISGRQTFGSYQATSAFGTSTGTCEGTILDGARRMVSVCRDSAIGIVRLEAVRP